MRAAGPRKTLKKECPFFALQLEGMWKTSMRSFWAGLFLLAAPIYADTITINGLITQDLTVSGATAVANNSLNAIRNGDQFTVALTFAGSIATPGTYALTSVLFNDAAASASEGAFISGSMTITDTAGMDQFSVLGCQIDPVTCGLGNQLDLNFEIPDTQLHQTGVTAQAVPLLLPLDLLEDNSNTEIQGSIGGYSYPGGAQVPEPSTFALIAAAGLSLTARNKLFGGKNA